MRALFTPFLVLTGLVTTAMFCGDAVCPDGGSLTSSVSAQSPAQKKAAARNKAAHKAARARYWTYRHIHAAVAHLRAARSHTAHAVRIPHQYRVALVHQINGTITAVHRAPRN